METDLWSNKLFFLKYCNHYILKYSKNYLYNSLLDILFNMSINIFFLLSITKGNFSCDSKISSVSLGCLLLCEPKGAEFLFEDCLWLNKQPTEWAFGKLFLYCLLKQFRNQL